MFEIKLWEIFNLQIWGMRVPRVMIYVHAEETVNALNNQKKFES